MSSHRIEIEAYGQTRADIEDHATRLIVRYLGPDSEDEAARMIRAATWTIEPQTIQHLDGTTTTTAYRGTTTVTTVVHDQ